MEINNLDELKAHLKKNDIPFEEDGDLIRIKEVNSKATEVLKVFRSTWDKFVFWGYFNPSREGVESGIGIKEKK